MNLRSRVIVLDLYVVEAAIPLLDPGLRSFKIQLTCPAEFSTGSEYTSWLIGQTRSEGGSKRLRSSRFASLLGFWGVRGAAEGVLWDLDGGVQSGPLGKGGRPDGMHLYQRRCAHYLGMNVCIGSGKL